MGGLSYPYGGTPIRLEPDSSAAESYHYRDYKQPSPDLETVYEDMKEHKDG